MMDNREENIYSLARDRQIRLDEIGPWSEIKLEIIKRYASEYSKILSAQHKPSLDHFYIDAFAGAGVHLTKKTKEFRLGSPLNALWVEPPFKEYHLIDLNSQRTNLLRDITKDYNNVFTYQGDCNSILIDSVFPRVKFENYKRALCLLDPYGLHLHWNVLEIAGKMKTIEIFLNFPIYDMNINVLRKNPDKVDPQQVTRLDSFWGDDTWRQAGYTTKTNLWDFEEKTDNETVVEAFRRRLIDVAGFKKVPKSIPMRNEQGATVYYLFFAAHRPVSEQIVRYIFNKYRDKGK